MFPPAEEPDRAMSDGFMGREWWVGCVRMEMRINWQSFGAAGKGCSGARLGEGSVSSWECDVTGM